MLETDPTGKSWVSVMDQGGFSQKERRLSHAPEANYILFSDVHLGADLVQHVRPWTTARLKTIARIDRDLAAMLDYYRAHRDPQRPWCLVIAGDLIDFIGMSIAPSTRLRTELNDDEHEHGLGSARDHAVSKMRAVARRHSLVFDRLARFIAEGHRLVLVRGNHDVDFHWDAAGEAFIRAIVDRIPDVDAEPGRRAELEARIELHPWFYYVKGLLYVEHGHQFDAVCNYPHLLAPLSPADPTRLHWSMSDWLLRVVTRPTPGLGSEGHEERGFLDYVRFGWSLGIVGGLRVFYRFIRAVTASLRTTRNTIAQRARAVRDEHERRMSELATRTQVRLELLRELTALWPRPVSSGVLPALRSVYLDRLLFAVIALTLIGGTVWLQLPLVWGGGIAAAVSIAYVGYVRWAMRRRALDVDPTSTMRRAARRIVELLPARYVVMGHTHEPFVERLGEAATYVNLGHWGVDDLDGEVSEPPRTHLVLRWIDGTHRAEFCRWDRKLGPKRLSNWKL